MSYATHLQMQFLTWLLTEIIAPRDLPENYVLALSSKVAHSSKDINEILCNDCPVSYDKYTDLYWYTNASFSINVTPKTLPSVTARLTCLPTNQLQLTTLGQLGKPVHDDEPTRLSWHKLGPNYNFNSMNIGHASMQTKPIPQAEKENFLIFFWSISC